MFAFTDVNTINQAMFSTLDWCWSCMHNHRKTHTLWTHLVIEPVQITECLQVFASESEAKAFAQHVVRAASPQSAGHLGLHFLNRHKRSRSKFEYCSFKYTACVFGTDCLSGSTPPSAQGIRVSPRRAWAPLARQSKALPSPKGPGQEPPRLGCVGPPQTGAANHWEHSNVNLWWAERLVEHLSSKVSGFAPTQSWETQPFHSDGEFEDADLPQELSSQRLLLLDLSPSLPCPGVIHTGPTTRAQFYSLAWFDQRHVEMWL